VKGGSKQATGAMDVARKGKKRGEWTTFLGGSVAMTRNESGTYPNKRGDKGTGPCKVDTKRSSGSNESGSYNLKKREERER